MIREEATYKRNILELLIHRKRMNFVILFVRKQDLSNHILSNEIKRKKLQLFIRRTVYVGEYSLHQFKPTPNTRVEE